MTTFTWCKRGNSRVLLKYGTTFDINLRAQVFVLVDDFGFCFSKQAPSTFCYYCRKSWIASYV